MDVVLGIITFVIAIAIVNGGQRLLMKIMGADAMTYSMRSKVIAIIVVAIFVFLMLNSCFHVA